MSQGTVKQNDSSPGSDTAGHLGAVSDEPSGTKRQDHLNFGPNAEALAFLIDWKCSKPPLTVAISGPRGAGKTSLALQVQEQLKTHGDWDNDHIICEFSAWKHDDAPNLGAAFAAKVAQSANGERHWWRRLIQPLPSVMLAPEKRWRRQIYVLLASLAVAVGLVLGPDTRDIITAAEQPTDAHWINAEHAAHGFGLTLIIVFAAFAFIYPKIFSGTQAVARFVNDPKTEAARGSIDSVSRQLGGLIASATRGHRRFVVFVDDLERCRPPRAVEVCEVVSQLLDHDDVVTVLVGDMDTIARSAAIKYRALELPTPGNADTATYETYGRSYMEKLVQLQFELPQPQEQELQELRKLLSSDNDQDDKQPSGPGAAFQKSLLQFLKIAGYTLIAAAGVAVTAVAYYSLTHLMTQDKLLGKNLRVIAEIIGAGLVLLAVIHWIVGILGRLHRRCIRKRIDDRLKKCQGKAIFQAVEDTSESLLCWKKTKKKIEKMEEINKRKPPGKRISRAVVTVSKNVPCWNKEEIVRRRYFNAVFDSSKTAAARDYMNRELNQSLPKGPREIKKFAYQMRLAIAIGVARGVFKLPEEKDTAAAKDPAAAKDEGKHGDGQSRFCWLDGSAEELQGTDGVAAYPAQGGGDGGPAGGVDESGAEVAQAGHDLRG